MLQKAEHEALGEELFLAGEKVLPGLYRQIGSGREVRLEHEDTLPASLDGRVACYLRIRNTWGQIAEREGVSFERAVTPVKVGV